MAELVSTSPADAGGPSLLAGRYRLEGLIAEGGNAQVWRATDTVLGREVAVKRLKPELSSNPIVVERFRREAVAAAKLSHPNIVAVFDTLSEAGTEAIVMELVRGRSLRQILDRERVLSPGRVADIGAQVAEALEASHRAGIVHRDIKPANVLVTPEGRVMVSDFGIAKAVAATTDLTSDQVMLGTAKYLSPEQVLGEPLDGRSDLYALGVLLYECLAGRAPFEAEHLSATALARLRQDPVPIERLRPDLPPELSGVIGACLARSRDGRPERAESVAEVLRRFADASTASLLRGSLGPTPIGVASGRPRPAAPRAEPTPTPRGTPNPGPLRPPAPGVPLTADGTEPAAGLRAATAPLADPGEPTPSGRRPMTGVAVALGALVALAALVLAAGVRLPWSGSGDDDPATVVGPATSSPTTVGTTVVATTASPGPPLRVAGLTVFDPPPGDGVENTGDLPAAIDGNPATAWSTEGYRQPDFPLKDGVGIVVRVAGPTTGRDLVISSPSDGWAASVFVAGPTPDRLSGWGDPVARVSGTAGDTTVPLGAGDGDHVLIWFTRLAGPDESGSYRVRISEITLR